ncbi:mucin-5B-like [Phymastichus coffea]|uniref:mucin-5B-like n=1 Tax=Phymastichus coffea TaxID=108790 RepID=UPI00273B15A6|nr:mucin-5B-like [Phymastichus coffea]
MVEEIEQEKARLEAMEVMEGEPPQPLPMGQERESILRWALTFQTRVPEADWRREERQRMEVIRAIWEEMTTAADQADGGTAETLSEHGTSKSHCSDTSKGSQLSLDGLEDYLGRGAESVPAGKGETTNAQPAEPSTPPPTFHHPGTAKSSASTISATTAQSSVKRTAATTAQPPTATINRPPTTTATPAATTAQPPTATTNQPLTTAAITATTIAPPTATTVQPSATKSQGHSGWLPVTSTPIGRTTTTRQ